MNLPTIQQNGRVCLNCRHAEPCARLCACRVSGRQLLEHQTNGDCPLGLFPPPVPDGEPLQTPQPAATGGESPCAKPERWGPLWWARFHTAAREGKITPQWLAAFVAGIPCGQCRADFLPILAASPLPAGATELHRWAFDVHNQVNARLGKPLKQWGD